MGNGVIHEIERKRAEFAYKCVDRVLKEHKNIKEKYKTYVKKIPMLIKNNGLGATFAFVKAKISEKEGEAGYAYKLIYEQTGNWLKEDYKQLIDLRGDEDLVIQIISLDSNTYRAVTAEVISFFTWLSRFAEGMIKGDDSNGG
ncbi:hypothetical protein H0A61_00197 [Koleobacter methoxysyntrophicus]|jgi:CRISPR-associated protein Cmr5|uniref:CRISPR type III-B/RAMP module-associated protein Cmr5 n=1 Tax=Koleobacter methoxysyntrophicus TaxID=2751313 RepID=A0A8A0RJR3_9FIRM|nr:type III-B CRISPR module-associated protein Cmr5 [Koleobacter methoxysyntrophicus]QSQ07880.1 hypothetical protein H0A61_00197 [Koleobacter methoxysyntrophicus]